MLGIGPTTQDSVLKPNTTTLEENHGNGFDDSELEKGWKLQKIAGDYSSAAHDVLREKNAIAYVEFYSGASAHTYLAHGIRQNTYAEETDTVGITPVEYKCYDPTWGTVNWVKQITSVLYK